jgi:hypothetical protein
VKLGKAYLHLIDYWLLEIKDGVEDSEGIDAPWDLTFPF